jgi:hypothetical protein
MPKINSLSHLYVLAFVCASSDSVDSVSSLCSSLNRAFALNLSYQSVYNACRLLVLDGFLVSVDGIFSPTKSGRDYAALHCNNLSSFTYE